MDPRYPIGRYHRPTSVDAATLQSAINAIAAAPAQLQAAVQGLTAEQLDTPYRDGGWTVRQVIHHVPESHFNGYTRCKLALTETHPVIKRKEGEWYREGLMKQVADLGLEDNVRFVDKYLTLQQLMDYLLATDVYVTPYYANPHQITSGTLAYAMATGKVIVSTPYLYAEELLADGRGFLYAFRDTAVLAQQIGRLLTDHPLFEKTRRRAYEYGRSMTWQSVGLQYTKLFTETLNERWVNHRAAVDTVALPGLTDLLQEGDIWAPPPVTAPVASLNKTLAAKTSVTGTGTSSYS